MPRTELQTRLVFALAALVALWALAARLSASAPAAGGWAVPGAIAVALGLAALEALGLQRLAPTLAARAAVSVCLGSACLLTLGR